MTFLVYQTESLQAQHITDVFDGPIGFLGIVCIVFGNAFSKQVTGIHTAEAKHETLPVSFTKWHSGLFGQNRLSKLRVNGNSLKANCLFGYALRVNAFNTDNLVSWKPNHMLMIWSGVRKQNYTLTITKLHHWQFGVRKTQPHTNDDKTTY